MELENQVLSNTKKTWISLTGYRTLFVLKLIMEKPRTASEIIQFLRDNPNTRKSLSKDTLRITMNTLKSVGCKFSKPCKANEHKFSLLYHPFDLHIDDDEFNVLLRLRDNLSLELSYSDVFILNDMFEKIMALSNSEDKVAYVEETKALIGVDRNLVKEFEKVISAKKKVQIIYDSPRNGEEAIDVIPKKITFENGTLYLFAYGFKYNENSLFNFSRIKKINTVYLSSEKKQNQSFEVVYKVLGSSFSTFEKTDNETIVSNENNELTIKALVDNEFWFVQRLLQFGTDFRIISPYSFREKLINKIKQIQKGYENDEI